jgi:nucleotide-binding universal stress UspA family protein
MMTKRILVPLGGGEPQEAVVPMVRALAREAGGTVRLLRIFPVPEQLVSASGRAITYLDQEMERLTAIGLDDLRRVELGLDGVPVESVVRFGAVPDEILLEADAAGADLIALSARKRGWLRGLLGWDVASEVARRSSVPTLVLHR